MQAQIYIDDQACTYTCTQTVSLIHAIYFVSYTLTLTLVIAVLAFWPQWNMCDVVNIYKCVQRRKKADSMERVKCESPV